MGLSISVTSTFIAKFPRIIWPIVITAIYVPIAIVGATSFGVALENFMAIIGQWLSIFCMVVLQEHFIFRKGNFANYDAEHTWNDIHALPMGLGALPAFIAGAIGAWAGMAEVWYIGPIGKLVGGDANPFGESDSSGLVAFAVNRRRELTRASSFVQVETLGSSSRERSPGACTPSQERLRRSSSADRNRVSGCSRGCGARNSRRIKSGGGPLYCTSISKL